MRRVPWTRQPPYPVGIDWSNPITRGLVICNKGADLFDYANGSQVSANVTFPSKSIKSGGASWKFSGAQCLKSKTISINGEYTYLAIAIPSSVSTQAVIGWTATSANSLWIPNGTICLHDGSVYVGTGVNPVVGTSYVIVAKQRGINSTIFVNGKITKANSGVNPVFTNYINLGAREHSGGWAFSGDLLLGCVWNRELSDAESATLTKNPWQIFEPYTVFGMSPTYVTAQTLTQSSSYSNTNTFYTHTLAATVSLAQSARFDNSNGLAYTHTLTPGVRALTQSSRFDNANTLNYTHTVTPGVRALTQSARFDNANGLAYAHTLAAAITLAQSSRYDNTNSLAYAHSLSASITLSQSSRFDNSNSLSYTHSISQVGGAQSLTQSARHDNGSTFYTHSLAAGAVGLTQSSRFDNTNGLAYAHTLAASISLPQGARFDNANGLSYVHVLSASITLAQSARFDNSNGLAYQHSISQAGGTQSLDQSARYDNTNGLSYQHTVSAGTVTLAQSARFDNAAQFFAHTVVQAADQFIFPAYYENANGFYQHQIGDGSVEIASGGAFHPPRIDDPRKRRRRDDETLLVIGAI